MTLRTLRRFLPAGLPAVGMAGRPARPVRRVGELCV